jgi:hypothetical protein
MIKTVGAATAGSIAFAGSASASADEEHLEEISDRATPDKPDEGEGKDWGGLRDETPAAVGAKAPKAVKRDVRKHEKQTVTTSATKSDSASRDLDGTSCDNLEVSTTMNGSFDSFWTYGGLQARWQSDGSSQANATGCGYSDKPDEFTISVTVTVNGVEMSASIAGFGGGTTDGTNSASYTGTFQNEDEASHNYENFVVKSPVALYNAKQEASTTAVFDTDAYSVSTRVSKS